MQTAEADDIIGAIKELVEQLAPDVRYVAKYGGEVFALDPDDDGQFVGWVFSYKDHVSLEFSEGASFDDPKAVLEGKGKARRHLKFKSVVEVEAKNAQAFLKQALSS